MVKKICIGFILCILFSWNIFGQSDESSLAKPILVTFEGQPALQFETGKNYSTVSVIKKYENEDAFMFFVTHNAQKKDLTDFLYITKTRVIYESPSNKKKSFIVLQYLCQKRFLKI